MGALVLIFSFCRVVFVIFNTDQFNTIYWTDFIAGIWFDIVTAAIAFLPLAGLEIFPNKWRDTKWFKRILAFSFQIIVFIGVLSNLIDVGFFRHSGSRSKSSLIEILQFGDDASNTIPGYIISYWYLLFILILFMVFSIWLYRRIDKIEGESKMTPWWLQILYLPTIAFILVSVGRGGYGLKPIAPVHASSYTTLSNIPIVLNSTFTIIKSWGEEGLKEKHFFNEKELNGIYSPYHEAETPYINLKGQNVVLIIIESFSIQYIKSLNGTQKGYTPFFDELVQNSMVFENCFANGKKSIDAMPSIISSIPKFMDKEYLSSAYSSNQIESIPKNLKKLGYSSGFFHAATNGSMNFDVFSDLAKFDQYFGRTEYNNEEDFDGTWGIFDHKFLPWSVRQMNQQSQPFFNTVFTISSHDPYTIPENLKQEFNSGPEPKYDAIAFQDYALKLFFEEAKKQSWYSNTLFILTADHTPAAGEPEYYSEIGKMRIPLILYHPTDTNFRGRINKVVSQNDIMPTLLNLLNYKEGYFAFGQNLFSEKEGYSFSQVGESKMLFTDLDTSQYLAIMHDDELTHIYELEDQLQTKNLWYTIPELRVPLEQRLKAIYQSYNHALITNEMTFDR